MTELRWTTGFLDLASRVHLDLHVADPFSAAEDVVGRGATVVADHGTYLLMSSPGGLPFCLVPHEASVVPSATAWPDGNRSRVDQVCLDVPPSAYDAELAFWQAVTEWETSSLSAGDEFVRLTPPAGQPLQLLLQRLEQDEAAVRAHLDWSATDQGAEVDRHVAAGARLVERFDRGWVVLAGPGGFLYCITGRSPQEDS